LAYLDLSGCVKMANPLTFDGAAPLQQDGRPTGIIREGIPKRKLPVAMRARELGWAGRQPT
jgi:hypothetical protein